MQSDADSRQVYIIISLTLLALGFLALHQHVTKCMRVRPTGLPWAALRSELFAESRAHVREWSQSRSIIRGGYHKYGKKGQAYLTPNRNWQPEVVLAPSQIRWLVELPETAVSIYKVLIEDVAFHYTCPRAWDFHRPFHIECLNKMNLDLMTDEMVDEIDLCTRSLLGDVPGKSRIVEVNSNTWNIIAHITNRAFAGKGLAHNEKYLMWNRLFISSLLPVSILIKAVVPAVLQPILGPILALPCRYFDHKCSGYLKDEIGKHMSDAKDERQQYERRNPNILQLMARFAAKSDDPRDWSTHNLASRLLALNFVGIHTSSAAAVNAWADILLSGADLIERLRSEAAAALKIDSKWTKAAVNKLELLDSTLRESLRFTAFKARGVERQVIAPAGVVLPDGTHLPYGTKVGVPTADIQRDASFYDRPDEFVPDRFVGRAEYGLVNTSETFLAFGHGRHACPGRFFSAHELKLFFAHTLLNYDIEPISERPEHIWVSDFYAPGIWTMTCTRRK